MTESISNLTPEQKLINRLDDDFMYLLHFTTNPLEKLSSKKQDLVKQWIIKLSTLQGDQDIKMKLIRNDYITKLLSCIQNDELKKPPFNQLPPRGRLENIEFDFDKVSDEIPTWVSELNHREENDVKIGGRGFETYFATKLMNNGVCSYLAVSTQNEGDRSAWMKIKPNRMNEDQMQKLYEDEFRHTNVFNQMR